MDESLCPCQSGKAFAQCCGPILDGKRSADTPETLMRARYTAYTRVNMEFIEQTHDPENKADIDMDASREWAESTNWTGLEVLETTGGGPDDEQGTVLFQATFEKDGETEYHNELSLFTRRNGQWYFTDGQDPTKSTVVRSEPKIGRNDPCPCGSGKKYKRCCAA